MNSTRLGKDTVPNGRHETGDGKRVIEHVAWIEALGAHEFTVDREQNMLINSDLQTTLFSL